MADDVRKMELVQEFLHEVEDGFRMVVSIYSDSALGMAAFFVDAAAVMARRFLPAEGYSEAYDGLRALADLYRNQADVASAALAVTPCRPLEEQLARVKYSKGVA